MRYKVTTIGAAESYPLGAALMLDLVMLVAGDGARITVCSV
jgi:hypothetical protein